MKLGFNICSPYTPECLIKIFKFSLYNHHINYYTEWWKSKNSVVMVPKWKWKLLSPVWLFVTPWTIQSWNSPGQYTGLGRLFLLQRIFQTRGLNPGLPHCRQILYQLSHKGSPRILEWVAYPFSRGSSWPRNWTRDFCIAGGFFTNWAMREALWSQSNYNYHWIWTLNLYDDL